MKSLKTIAQRCLLSSIKRAMLLFWLLLPSITGGVGGWVLTSCEREPPLHLYDAQEITTDLPLVDLDLQIFWDYEMAFDVHYDWRAEWFYGWDAEDGEMGYTEPTVFNLRRYYTRDVPYAPHTSVIAPPPFSGTHYQDRFDWGYWDVLVWNEIKTLDGIQSLLFDEKTSLDYVTASTGPSMNPSRYHAPRHTRSFHAPEPLFSAYEQGIEINRNLDGFVYDPERNVYVRKLSMMMYPITYIYLTQVILHNNNGRITKVVDNSNLSGLASSTTLNTGTAGDDPISVYYTSNLKTDCPLVPYGTRDDAPERATAEHADIIGGRLMTFGMCGQTPRLIKSVEDVTDVHRHYMDVTVQFYNEMDSTIVFDVTDQVRQRYKGGVITVELDMNEVPIPRHKGGSGFDAVVKEVENVEVPVIEL